MYCIEKARMSILAFSYLSPLTFNLSPIAYLTSK